MKIELEVEDYITREQMEEVALTEFKYALRSALRETEVVRVLGNLTYELVMKKVDEMVPHFEEIMAKKVAEKIDDLAVYHVFRNADSYGSVKSTGQIMIDKIVASQEEKIKTIVGAIIDDFNQKDITYIIEEEFNRIVRKMFKTNIDGGQ